MLRHPTGHSGWPRRLRQKPVGRCSGRPDNGLKRPKTKPKRSCITSRPWPRPADLDQAPASLLVETMRGVQVAVAGDFAQHDVCLTAAELDVRRASGLCLVGCHLDLDTENLTLSESRDLIRELTPEPAPGFRRDPIQIHTCRLAQNRSTSSPGHFHVPLYTHCLWQH